MTLTKKLWIGIGVLIVLSPLGLILPDHFKAGSAWGEWGLEEIQKMTGYVPLGFQKLSGMGGKGYLFYEFCVYHLCDCWYCDHSWSGVLNRQGISKRG